MPTKHRISPLHFDTFLLADIIPHLENIFSLDDPLPLQHGQGVIGSLRSRWLLSGLPLGIEPLIYIAISMNQLISVHELMNLYFYHNSDQKASSEYNLGLIKSGTRCS